MRRMKSCFPLQWAERRSRELAAAAEQYALCRTERTYKTLDFLKGIEGMNT